MPTATNCRYRDRTIDVRQALLLKISAASQKRPAPAFHCAECGKPVKPHRRGGHAAAHFEHMDRNVDCSLSHRVRKRNANRRKLVVDYDLDDVRAVEGYEVDRRIVARARNRDVAERCKKRDNYTCKACGFTLQIGSRHIIECHHLDPLSNGGVREVFLKDLVCLCPTCHRIAHTRRTPFKPSEIKELLLEALCKPVC